MSAGSRVPDHDLVVITRGDNAAIGLLSEAPDLTVRVRVHDVLPVGAVAEDDGAVTLTDEHLAVLAVNGPDEAELLSALNRLSVGVNAVELAVLATRVELALAEADGRDETAVGLDSALAGTAIIAAPDVDGTIGTTGVACAIVTPSDTSVRGHLVTAVETLGLITTLLASIPEPEMLDTSGGESLAAGLVVPCDVEDLVLVTLVLEDHLTLVVVAVDVVIVVDINSADHVLGVDVASGNTTSALANLHAVFLLA